MQEVIPFNFHSSEVRVVTIDGEPWFVASDALEILGVDRTSLRGLDEDEKGVDSIHTLGGIQGVTVISESGLYSLILRSRKPEAKTFKRWITHEVIPSIRKAGAQPLGGRGAAGRESANPLSASASPRKQRIIRR